MEVAIDPSIESEATHQRILNVIQEASQPSENNSTGLFEDFVCGEVSLINDLYRKTSQQQRLDDRRPSANDMICRMLLDAVKDPADHIEKLDSASRRFAQLKITLSLVHKPELADRVVDVLRRLSRNARLYREENDETLASSMDSAFLVQEANEWTSKNLQVMNFLPTPVLQLAVLVTLPVPHRQNWHGQATRDFANMVARCLETTLSLKPEASFDAVQLFVVRSYLWNMWHHCLTLHRYYILKLHLDFGFTYPVHQALRTRGLRIEEIVRNQHRNCGELTGVASEIPEEMNSDALDLLRADPSAVGINYEPLYHHFRRAFMSASSTNLSVHTSLCNMSCSYVTRNENEFRTFPGAVAVALLPALETSLQYCEASAHTMTISLFWAQAQDGSASSCATYPACWHEKLCALARKSGCDSYWIDIMCLPIEKTARRCAIASVNSVFEKSKLTVICDRSIMAIDKNEDEEDETPYMEKILATMLVCNWNLEAWSLVAAMKGARTLHLLCKDDVLLPVHNLVQAVHRGGSIELVNLSLFSYHFLRPSTSWVLSSMKTIFWSDNATGIFVNRDTRTLAVEEAGRLLRYRRTNLGTDHIHIWCLLTGAPIVDTASEFWRYVSSIHTGYIFSAMPRISETVDFTWAPVGPSPSIVENRFPFHMIQWSVWYSQQTEIAENISTPGNHLKGLRGVWNFCSLEHLNLTREIAPIIGHTLGIADELMKSRNDGGLIKTLRSLKSGIGPIPINDEEWHVKNKMTMHVNKISAAWHLLQLPGASRKKLSSVLEKNAPDGGQLALIYPHVCHWGHEDNIEHSTGLDVLTLVVVSSGLGDQYGAKWRWLGVIEWDKSVQLPSLQKRRITLI